MNISRRLIGVFLLILITFSTRVNAAGGADIRSTIHLLEYIMQDYPNAVQHGKAVNKGEFEEMSDFGKRVLESANADPTLSKNEELQSVLTKLDLTIQNKGPYDTVNYYTFRAKELIMDITKYQASPAKWPDLTAATVLFTDHCQRCHGIYGNGQGPDAAGMEPSPRNFHDDDRMKRISAASAFNTIRLGIEGTSMKGNIDLSDEDIWNLAFYVLSIRYQDVDSIAAKKAFDRYQSKIDLASISSLSDTQLVTKLGIPPATQHLDLAALRTCKPEINNDDYLGLAKRLLEKSLAEYKLGHVSEARQLAIEAYLDGIEPVELQLKSLEPQLVADLEAQMMQVRKGIDEKIPAAELGTRIEQSDKLIDKASELLKGNKPSFIWLIIMTATILLREALEALLVVIILIKLIKAANADHALKWIHSGWIIALVMGLISWLFSESLVSWGMSKFEIFEGVVSVIAVIVVVYIGFWMHSHTEIDKWKSFVNDKLGKLIKTENFVGLAFLSFVVVGREVFESVLFLTALNVESHNTAGAPIAIGFIIALSLSLGLGYILLNVTKNIPIRQILRISSFILALLAVILVGKSIHSFQEIGWVPVHTSILSIRIEALGVFPTAETMIGQGLMILLISGVIFLTSKKKTN
jgi:high-affinity iron transporter